MPRLDMKEPNAPFMSLLPNDLLHLETKLVVSRDVVSAVPLTCLAWANPPLNLQTISKISMSSLIGSNPLEFLPQSLTNCIFETTYLSWSPELIASLPPKFGILVIDNYCLSRQQDAVPPSWPASLHTLTLHKRAFNKFAASPDLLESLPKTLTELNLIAEFEEIKWPIKEIPSFSIAPSGFLRSRQWISRKSL